MLQVSTSYATAVYYFWGIAWFSRHDSPAYGEFFHLATATMATLIPVNAVSLAGTRYSCKEKKRRKRRVS